METLSAELWSMPYKSIGWLAEFLITYFWNIPTLYMLHMHVVASTSLQSVRLSIAIDKVVCQFSLINRSSLWEVRKISG